jgi:hypothetical protein
MMILGKFTFGEQDMFDQPYLIPVNEKEYYLAQDFTYEWLYQDKQFRVIVYNRWGKRP